MRLRPEATDKVGVTPRRSRIPGPRRFAEWIDETSSGYRNAMKTREKTKLGLALAIRYRRVLARIALAMGRHPKRTINVGKAGKRVVRTTSEYRSNPKAQRRAREALKSADKARKRIRTLGGQAAITDKRVLRDLQIAADGIAQAIAISSIRQNPTERADSSSSPFPPPRSAPRTASSNAPRQRQLQRPNARGVPRVRTPAK